MNLYSKNIKLYYIYIFFLLGVQHVNAHSKVKFSADSLEYYKDEEGREINKLTGNVKFIKNGLTITADEANYEEQERIEARGNVIIEKIRPDHTKLIIKTEFLIYQVKKEFAEFKDGVILIDGNNTLTSDIGEYDDKNDTAKFYGNITITNDEQIVKCDMLSYETLNEYLLKEHNEIFKGLKTDNIYKKKIYLMEGNIDINVFKQNLIMKSDYCVYFKDEDKLKLYGSPILKKSIKKDDFYLYSKKIIIENDKNLSDKNEKKMTALEDVSLYNKNIKAKSDEIEYLPSESIVNFGVNSIFWTEDSQLTADEVKLKIKEDNIEKMIMKNKALIIQKDPFGNYNQVKGNAIDMLFKNNNVYHMNIKGDAQSIQFLSNEEDEKLVGINHIKCEEIKIDFNKKNKPKKVLFLGKKYSDTLGGFMMAPKNANIQNTRFQGFKWRAKEKPTYDEVKKLLKNRSEGLPLVLPIPKIQASQGLPII